MKPLTLGPKPIVHDFRKSILRSNILRPPQQRYLVRASGVNWQPSCPIVDALNKNADESGVTIRCGPVNLLTEPAINALFLRLLAVFIL